jgi:hypothetical protein
LWAEEFPDAEGGARIRESSGLIEKYQVSD